MQEGLNDLAKSSTRPDGTKEYLYRVLVTKRAIPGLPKGKVIDGVHRKMHDPKWPEEEVDCKTLADYYRLRLKANWSRRIADPEEITHNLDMIMEHSGDNKPTVQDLANDVGKSERTIWRYLSDQWKNRIRAEAGRRGGEASGRIKKLDFAATVAAKEHPLLVLEKDGNPMSPEEACGVLLKSIQTLFTRIRTQELPKLMDYIPPDCDCSTCPASVVCSEIIEFLNNFGTLLPSCISQKINPKV